MKLELTPLEKKQMIIWAENTISGGHFGDGDVVFPEEGVTLDKLQKSDTGTMDVSSRDLTIMLIWCENAVGKTLRGMTQEEISLIGKLKQAVEIMDNSTQE